MTSYDFFTDRVNAPVPTTSEQLKEATAAGLKALIFSKIDANWFAKRFPKNCEDGQGIHSTNRHALWETMRGFIPDLPEYMGGEWPLTDGVIFDFVEYAAQAVSKPREKSWHDFYKHHELSFDKKAGEKEFRAEVNTILRRGGSVFELDKDLKIVRTGSPSVQDVIQKLVPLSGDTKLDKDLSQAVNLYRSRHPEDRTIAIEKLWDGFERLKTLDRPGKKPASIAVLLNNISSPEFRTFVEDEMRRLTELGNSFEIRHHEVGKHPVPLEAQDYIFVRMASLVTFLLQESERLA